MKKVRASNNSLELDMKNAAWFCSKVQADASYAQNVYAALCNQEWQKLDVMDVLTDSIWSSSWRYAGGIVADILGQGDYLDWYCSGMGPEGNGNGHGNNPAKRYVPEGCITDEIRADFKLLGWIPFDEEKYQ